MMNIARVRLAVGTKKTIINKHDELDEGAAFRP
jgi:hypothetical protein